MDRRIREIAVVGGGITGWSAAAALKRRLPALSVTILATPPAADALADRPDCALPSILGFHGDLGLRDEDAVARTGSSVRLGTLFEGWSRAEPDYVHAYGEHGRAFGTASFHQHWVRARQAGRTTPFDRYSPAAVLARAGRFAPPPADPAAPIGQFDWGLFVDPPAYLGMIRAFARHCGVIERGGSVAEVRLRAADGFIEGLSLDGGDPVAADLFVDCTGPGAMLRSRLDQTWESWRDWLPCDRLLFGNAAPQSEPVLLDRATAVPAGWRWVAPGLTRTGHGICYSSTHLSDTAAAQALRDAGAAAVTAPVAIAAGTRPRPWLRNCVAIGDAATAIEPLEWTNLHLAHSAIDRIVAMLPDRDCSALELAEYNRQCAAEALRVRDFVALHYAASDRPEPFWRAAAAAAPPPSLAHTLAQFGERGRLPFYEEETFARDSWLAVLLGQGVIPRRADPLIASAPFEQSERAMAGFRESLVAAMATFPPYAAHLGQTKRQFA